MSKNLRLVDTEKEAHKLVLTCGVYGILEIAMQHIEELKYCETDEQYNLAFGELLDAVARANEYAKKLYEES